MADPGIAGVLRKPDRPMCARLADIKRAGVRAAGI